FSSAVYSDLGAYPWAAAAGDFNGDGWLDAATANSTSDVSVLLNVHSWPSPPPPAVFIGDAAVTEGNTGTVNATFPLTFSSPYNQPSTVHYEPGAGSARAGRVYPSGAGDVVTPAGQPSGTFTVAVSGDRVAEPTEYFAVTLTAATNATIADGQG